MKEKYYGVAGVNGYGVYDDYEKAMKSRLYIKCWQIKKMKSFVLAKGWAEDMYQNLQPDNWQEYSIQEIERVNWAYYRKQI